MPGVADFFAESERDFEPFMTSTEIAGVGSDIALPIVVHRLPPELSARHDSLLDRARLLPAPDHKALKLKQPAWEIDLLAQIPLLFEQVEQALSLIIHTRSSN